MEPQNGRSLTKVGREQLLHRHVYADDGAAIKFMIPLKLLTLKKPLTLKKKV